MKKCQVRNAEGDPERLKMGPRNLHKIIRVVVGDIYQVFTVLVGSIQTNFRFGSSPAMRYQQLRQMAFYGGFKGFGKGKA